VMLVKLDRPDPNITQWANYNAAPIFAQVARRLLDHMNVPPSDALVEQEDSEQAPVISNQFHD